MTQPETEPIERESGRTESVYQAAKSGYDLIHDFSTNKPVQLIISLIIIIGGNLLLGSPLNIVAVLIGFFIALPAAWLLFPYASFSWIIRTNLEKKIVHPEKIPILDGSELLDKEGAQQLFRDEKGKTTIVYGQHQAISEAVTLSDIHYLNDISVLPKAVKLMGPLIL